MDDGNFNPDAPSLIVIESDDEMAARVLAGLTAHYPHGSVQRLSALDQASRLLWQKAHLAVFGIDDSDNAATSLMEVIRKQRNDLPILLLVSEAGIDYALRGLDNGACDYVIKTADVGKMVARAVEKNLKLWARQQRLGERATKMEQSLSVARKRNRELAQAVLRFQAMAGTDPLTGLANRRAFGRAMDQTFAEMQRYGGELACVMIDLDGFKQLNDTFGHTIGDRVLERVARVLEANCRESDLAARFGGDEFIVLLPQTSELEANEVAKRIQREFEVMVSGEVDISRLSKSATLSIGIACLPRTEAVSAEQLIAAADKALYQAKQCEKPRLAVYDRQTLSDKRL